MATYDYTYPAYSPGRIRFLEAGAWFSLILFGGFSFLLLQNKTVAHLLSTHWTVYLAILLLIYFLFLIPSRQLSRYNRYSKTRLDTTRKGLVFKDMHGDKTLSWRDIQSANLTFDATVRNQVYIRRMDLLFAKGRIRIESEPPKFGLQGSSSLLAELADRVPVKNWRETFVWYQPFCPYCATLLEDTKPCSGCGHLVAFKQKLLRPWDVFREDTAFVVLFLLFSLSGPGGWMLSAVGLTIVFWWIYLPFLLARPQALQGMQVGEESPVEAAEAPVSPVKLLAALALVLSLLLVPAQVAAPPSHDVKSLFPLAVGTVWEYDTNYGHMILKVAREETLNGQVCSVVETYVEGTTETTPVQSEYYAVVNGDVQVLKRVYRGADETVLDPPETVLKDPVLTGQHWTWDGQTSNSTAHLDFHVMPSEKIQWKGQKTPVLCTKVILSGRTVNNSEIEVKRWYAPNIGMVKESSVMSKGKQTMQVTGMLVKFRKP